MTVTMPMQNLLALALAATIHGTLAASTAPSVREDCGCIWQQEYKALHAAIKLGKHAHRYTAVSYHDMGEAQTCALRCMLTDNHFCALRPAERVFVQA